MLKKAVCCIASLLFAAGAQAQPYLFNRAPLEEVSYAELPLGAIRPEGWLKEQLKRQAEIQQRNLQETTSHQKQLMADYKKLILPKSSVVFDRIATVVPEGLQLTLMERLGKQTIIVSGNAPDMSEVIMFSESLKGKFNTVEIRSMETRVNDAGYSFNMLIEP